MAKWQRELNLLPEWKMAQAGEITGAEMAGVIAKRLAALKPFGDPDWLDFERDDLVGRFEDIARDRDDDLEDFDCVMDDLYDWADTHIRGDFFNAEKACWVRTF